MQGKRSDNTIVIYMRHSEIYLMKYEIIQSQRKYLIRNFYLKCSQSSVVKFDTNLDSLSLLAE